MNPMLSPEANKAKEDARIRALAYPPKNGTLVATQQQTDAKLAQQKWAARVAELIAPTLVRPALTTQAEADNIRRRFTTPDGALAQLEKVVATRLAWLSARDGFPTTTPINENEAVAAAEFFARHGDKPVQESATPPAPPLPTPVATPPAQAPKQSAPTPTLPDPSNPATLTIEYLNGDGWPLTLTIPSTSTPNEIAALVQRGDQAVRALKGRNATPRTQARPASGVGDTESAPICAIHNKPMSKVEGRKGSFWSCHEKLADGSYCPYKPTRS